MLALNLASEWENISLTRLCFGSGSVGGYTARPTIANAPPNRSWRQYGSIRKNAGPPSRDKAAIRKGLLFIRYTCAATELCLVASALTLMCRLALKVLQEDGSYIGWLHSNPVRRKTQVRLAGVHLLMWFGGISWHPVSRS